MTSEIRADRLEQVIWFVPNLRQRSMLPKRPIEAETNFEMQHGERLYRVVQPWGRDRAVESTVVSQHSSAEEAFAAIDTFAEQMINTGVPGDAVELIVINPRSRIVMRPES